MHRRKLLLSLGVVLSGCAGSGTNADTPSASSPTQTPEPTPTRTPESESTESPTPVDYARRFRQELISHRIDVGSVSVSRGRVSLEYSLDDASMETLDRSIPMVASSYATTVSAGWATDGLDAVVLGPEADEVASYRVDQDWAREFNDGAMDTDTYSNKVEGTLDIEPGAITTPTPSPTPSPAEVTLGGDDAEPNDEFTKLLVKFNHDTKWRIDPDPGNGNAYRAPTGQKWVAVQVVVINLGDEDVSVPSSGIDLKTGPESRVKRTELEGTPNPLDGTTIEAHGGETEGWLPYLVDEELTDADLAIDQSVFSAPIRCDFDRDHDVVVEL